MVRKYTDGPVLRPTSAHANIGARRRSSGSRKNVVDESSSVDDHLVAAKKDGMRRSVREKEKEATVDAISSSGRSRRPQSAAAAATPAAAPPAKITPAMKTTPMKTTPHKADAAAAAAVANEAEVPGDLIQVPCAPVPTRQHLDDSDAVSSPPRAADASDDADADAAADETTKSGGEVGGATDSSRAGALQTAETDTRRDAEVKSSSSTSDGHGYGEMAGDATASQVVESPPPPPPPLGVLTSTEVELSTPHSNITTLSLNSFCLNRSPPVKRTHLPR